MERVAHGYNGDVNIDGSVVRIKRKESLLASMNGLNEDEAIPFHAIGSVEFKPATALTNGYLEIVPHGAAAVGGLLKNTKNSLAVVFTKNQQSDFEALRGRLLEELKSSANRPLGALPTEAQPAPLPQRPVAYAPASQVANSSGEKTRKFHSWYAFIATSVTIFSFWMFAGPWMTRNLGISVPWWGYVLLFLLFFGGLVNDLAKQKATENVAYGEVQVRAHRPVGESAFCSNCGIRRGEGSFCAHCGVAAAMKEEDALGDVGLLQQRGAPVSNAGLRPCPHCAEFVRSEAKICRFCQRDLPPLPEHREQTDDGAGETGNFVELNGTCPNCDKVIALASEKCQHCNASFGPYSAWAVQPLSQATRPLT